MSTEANKSLVRRLFEQAFGKVNLAVLDQSITPTQVHGGPGVVPGKPSEARINFRFS